MAGQKDLCWLRQLKDLHWKKEFGRLFLILEIFKRIMIVKKFLLVVQVFRFRRISLYFLVAALKTLISIKNRRSLFHKLRKRKMMIRVKLLFCRVLIS